jgi:LEA14-like dessication related protein
VYSMSIEGETYLTGQKLKKIELKALDTQKLSLPLEFKFKKYMKVLKGRDSAVSHFSFELLLTTPDIKQEHIIIPLDKKMPLVTDIDVEVTHVKINKFGFNNTDLTAYIKIGNPNNVDLNLDHLHYIVKVDGQQWVDGHYTKLITLRKKATANFQFPIHLDTKKITKSAKDYLSGDKVQHYEILADFNVKLPDPTIKNIQMDVRNEGVLHLSKLLKGKSGN